MSTRTPALLIVLLLAACTPHDGPTTRGNPPAIVANPTPADPPPADHPTATASITIAVASVQLEQDCPDPPTPATAPEREAERSTTERQQRRNLGEEAKRSGDSRMACAQSSVQLSLANTGALPGTLRVLRVRLLDAAQKRELSPLRARTPTRWSERDGYLPWDEQVPANASLQVAYKLGDPDWAQVQRVLGASASIDNQPYIVELDVSVDEREQTVRSPEFVRRQLDMVET
ncbi:hypothetical protein [Nannocystis sp.]|uniref:hypothetical protein n=1 Tax=Nannocystis sp. TaxID=1962667 RepID=UPI0025DEDA59|nr:hypothetical protein [Nannocystis sp.]MBK7826482.1 hypothetical protein [Nannocystis sp.]